MARFDALGDIGRGLALGEHIAQRPQRDAMAQLGLQKQQQALAGQQQQQTAGQTQFDQSQSMQRSKITNQAMKALKNIQQMSGMTIEQSRSKAFDSIAPKLEEFGIDTNSIRQNATFTDQELDNGIAKTQAFIATPDSPIKRTSLQQNLIAAGLEPGTKQFQNAVLAATQKPSTQVTIGGEKKFAEEVAKGQAKTFSRIGGEADAAIDANQSLDVLEAIDVDTGALEPAKQGIAAFANAFGLDASGLANVSKGEAFNAEAQRIVLAVKASQKGPQTDKDEATIRKTVANLGNTKAGNQFIINSARALNNRRIERKDFYDRFVEDAGGQFRNDQGVTADRAWAKFKRETPMISSKLRTPQGLPVFFFEFERDVRQANPDARRKEIIEIWNQKNRGSK